jgi:hypothetical protein
VQLAGQRTHLERRPDRDLFASELVIRAGRAGAALLDWT